MRGVQSRCFFDRARLPTAAQRSNSVMVSWILSPYVAKAVMVSIEKTEGESIDPTRANAAPNSPGYLFPTYACADVS